MNLRNIVRLFDFAGHRRTSCVDLDDPRVENLRLNQASAEQPANESDDDNPIWSVVMLVLSQCMLDEALCLHIFVDEQEECIRLQEYMHTGSEWQPGDWMIPKDGEPYGWTSPEPQQESSHSSQHLEAGNQETRSSAGQSESDDSRASWNWVEMYPAPIGLQVPLFEEIKSLVNIPTRATGCDFKVRYGDKYIESHIDVLSDVDLRLYFGDARPVIRAKTAAQIAEVRSRRNR